MKKKIKKVILNETNYIDRDESWIEFNSRVIFQSLRETVPFIERIRFLGISANNLDEFIMVRFAGILNGDTDNRYYHRLRKKIIAFKKKQETIFRNLLIEMEEKFKVKISKINELNEKELKIAESIFDNELYPLLVPLSCDDTKEFPHVQNKHLYMVVQTKGESDLVIVPLSNVDRMYRIGEKYMLVEDIIEEFLGKLLINTEVQYSGLFRLIRSAAMELDVENKDIYIVDRMKQILDQREWSFPVSMDVSSDIPRDVLFDLVNGVGIDDDHVYKTSIVDLVHLMKPKFDIADQTYPSFIAHDPIQHMNTTSMFEIMSKDDVLLHHPYDSFEPIVRFLSQAANDKNVVAIRQTLYRVSSEDSPVIEALCRASTQGKQVSVLLEIKARFDEKQNIALIDKLTSSGCNVIYGIEELKTHCKFAIVIRKERKKIKVYSHIGTGNYNDSTARVYTDISLFTSNKKIGVDLITIFNILSGTSKPKNEVSKIKFSPFNIRKTFFNKIDREVENVKNGKKGLVILKLNSLSDRQIVEKIYEASMRGVEFHIICRGICSLKPINDNIKIQSIVGRFLEHSRIYYFHNNNKQEIFISSADLLTRNLDRRIEIMVPVENIKTKSKLLRVLLSHRDDTYNSCFMSKHGYFGLPDENGKNIHNEFIAKATSYKKVKNQKIK